MRLCPSCGRENADDARFCSGCATPLAGADELAREERKIVTVVFADIVGSTATAERLDPEDVRARLTAFHQRLRRELERFGGTVEKFIGDAVMAVFGAPVAHEDDAERAVRAALAIREAIAELNVDEPALELQVRVGVNSGEALVSLGVRPEHGEAMVAGDVVNTAARIQGAAPVNGILVGEPTYRATRTAIDYRETDPVEAKGKAEPIPVWEAVQARARFGVDVRQHGAAPLVGRQRELALLLSMLERVKAEREVQLVTVVGVPGIGKSRLVYELFAALEDEPDLVYWRQGRCLPYGDGVVFWALAEIVKAQAGILETDPPAEVAAKLARAVAALEVDDPDWVQRHLSPLVGRVVANEGQDRAEESFAAWRTFFEGLADHRPLVLVFDDLQWGDDRLLDFVDHLAEWARGVPMLVICTARPELFERRPGWGGGKLNATTIALSPLSDEETAVLLGELSGRRLFDAETQRALLARAEGNPLYAEQFIGMLGDRGIGAEELPATVQGIIAARLDALPVEEKTLLQDAAVIGKVFWAGAAAALGGDARSEVEDRLHALERKDFVRRERRSSVEGDAEYVFRHALVAETAYAQMPRAARAARHRRAGEWIESLGRPEDHAEMLAHHYVRALEYTRAAGEDTAELADKARRTLKDAGERAAALYSYVAAAHLFDTALELWPDDTERPYLLLNLARARFRRDRYIPEEVLVEARDSLLAVDNRPAAAEIETMLADAALLRGDGPGRDAHLERAVSLVESEPPSYSKAWVLGRVGWRRGFATRHDEALRLGREALGIADALGADELRANLHNLIGSNLTMIGDDAAIEELEKSIAIALEINSPEALWAYGHLGIALHERGELERAFALQHKAEGLAQRFGQGSGIAWATAWRIEEYYLLGRWDEAIAIADPYIDATEADFKVTTARFHRARIRIARGDTEGALDDSARALDFNRGADDARTLWDALAVRARALVSAGSAGEARALADEVLEDWRVTRALPSGSPPVWLFDLQAVLAELGATDQLEGPVSRTSRSTPWLDAASAFARRDFAEAAEVYARVGALSEEAYARLRAAEHGGPAADTHLAKALEFHRSVGAKRYIAEGEALIARSA